MKLGYVIVYVRDPSATAAFYERAFGIACRFIHESGYAELATGDTALAFAAETLAKTNSGPFHPSRPENLPPAFEIAFTTTDVPAAFARAVSAGAAPVKPPAAKPWGQMVAYVRDQDGALVELCSPMGG